MSDMLSLCVLSNATKTSPTGSIVQKTKAFCFKINSFPKYLMEKVILSLKVY